MARKTIKTRKTKRVRWGQHFLTDSEVCRRIVDWAAIKDKTVVEIGPGRGAITGLLAESAARLVLIEVDPMLAATLERRYDGVDHVEVLTADVLSVDLERLVAGPVYVVANLPFESATAIIARLLAAGPWLAEMVVMVQREVGERLVASEGSKRFGRLSIMISLCADTDSGPLVGPESFQPAPKVDSIVVRIRPLARPRFDVGEQGLFEDMVEAAFVSRRKMLRNGLGPWLDKRLGAGSAEGVLSEAGIEGSLRPEALAPEAYARLSRIVHARLRPGAGTT
ncbi:MAG: 16S rRNA (adenine(1518)-N(6)/adenine(1519)-N(6))-dimethyltransferase RsmA [Deltaproteobacteria bacterium]